MWQKRCYPMNSTLQVHFLAENLLSVMEAHEFIRNRIRKIVPLDKIELRSHIDMVTSEGG